MRSRLAYFGGEGTDVQDDAQRSVVRNCRVRLIGAENFHEEKMKQLCKWILRTSLRRSMHSGSFPLRYLLAKIRVFPMELICWTDSFVIVRLMSLNRSAVKFSAELENSLPTQMVRRCFLVSTFTIDRRSLSADRLPALAPRLL